MLVITKDAMGVAVKDFIGEAYTRLEMISEPGGSEAQEMDILSLIKDVTVEEYASSQARSTVMLIAIVQKSCRGQQ